MAEPAAPQSPPPPDWQLPRDAAIPRLLDTFGGRLYALARRLCGNPDEADDLVQEVFLLAYRKWDQFDHRASPITWLYTIATRACQRMHRRRSGQPAHIASLDELLPFGQPRIAFVPADDDVVDSQVHRERSELVGDAIAQLPDDFRVPLVLKEIVGFSLREIGDMLGIREATVKTRVHRARLRVRDALAQGLPHREMPPTPYSRQVCLDLLATKQESLDRGVEMPNADAIICERCSAVFATLDLTRDVCRSLGDGDLPADLRELLLDAVRAEQGREGGGAENA